MSLSETRREIAEAIARGEVRYELPHWYVGGSKAGGWTGRTLREMRRDGLIDAGSDGVVRLTESGQEALSSS